MCVCVRARLTSVCSLCLLYVHAHMQQPQQQKPLHSELQTNFLWEEKVDPVVSSSNVSLEKSKLLGH